MKTLLSAALDVYHPGNTDEPDFTIPGDEIERLSYSERAGYRKDDGELIINNDGGEYTDRVTSGDRLEFRVNLSGDPLQPWGDRTWNDGMWSGHRTDWSALVRDTAVERTSVGRATLTVDAEDYALGVLQKRQLYRSFVDERVDTIIRVMLREKAPELEVAVHPSLQQVTTAVYDGERCFDALKDLASRLDAVVRIHGNAISVRPFTVPAPAFTVGADDITLPIGRVARDDGLVNAMRVDGPRARAIDRDASREGTASFREIPEETALQFQIPIAKSEIDAIELHTRKRSEADFTVRLQRNRNGAPVAWDDRTRDIARRTLSHEFVAHDGFTEFLLPGHTLPEPNPWVIVQVDGGSHGLGVDANGRAVRRVYYPYPVGVQDSDPESIREFIRREDRLQLHSGDLDDARDRAAAEIRRNRSADILGEINAESHRMHTLRPGQVVTLEFDRDGLTGEHFLMERAVTYESHELETTHIYQDATTV